MNRCALVCHPADQITLADSHHAARTRLVLLYSLVRSTFDVLWEGRKPLMASVSNLREARHPISPMLLRVLSDMCVIAGIPKYYWALVREGHTYCTSRMVSENELRNQALSTTTASHTASTLARTLGLDEQPGSPYTAHRADGRGGAIFTSRSNVARCPEGAAFACHSVTPD